MEEKDLPSWDAFESELQALRQESVSKYPRPLLLFRGHCDAEFELSTTLERTCREEIPFGSYYRLAATQIKPAVETFTGVTWDVPSWTMELEKSFHDGDLRAARAFPTPAFYRYMVYLRHHGFPSPLLDWSYSPYVAAFFAYRDEPITKPRKRSIYLYRDTQEGMKVEGSDKPIVRHVGPYVQSHPRHFRQQSDYTISYRWNESSGWVFCPHNQAIGIRPGQDIVQKFNLPSSERDDILQLLDQYNLNAFSLYDSEETLLETMWFREYVLKRPFIKLRISQPSASE